MGVFEGFLSAISLLKRTQCPFGEVNSFHVDYYNLHLNAHLSYHKTALE